jgi:hypothetical protein
MTTNRALRRAASELAAVVLVLIIYSYPSFRARGELGSTVLPPMFAPDLSLYLNLGNLTTIGENTVMNPYYRVPVPSNGSGYLKFGLAARLFGNLNRLLDDHMWFAMLLWNVFWWGLFCVVALCVFGCFLPVTSPPMVIIGLGLVMLVNFGILKSLLIAWIRLPSLSAFDTLGLPFMRAFIPVIPSAFVLAYLGLQMEALRRRSIISWIAMGALQLLALAVFPYATLMMAGLTAVSVVWQTRLSIKGKAWRIPLVYGVACAFLDGAFLWHSSLGFYEKQSSTIHFQPQLLPHLIGGNWLLLFGLTVAVAFSQTIVPEVKWALVGFGASNAVLMLGDAIVPATTILLSHHAAHFIHVTMATLITFLAAATLASVQDRSTIVRTVLGVILVIILLNGALLASGTYRGFLPTNREIVELSRLRSAWGSRNGDLVIARSKNVDDPCAWIALLAKAPVLFCTDAEVMLTPQQNRDIHRFRQALYLYLSGKDSGFLQRELAAPDPSSLMYRLGYWAEASSLSVEERKEGIRAIQADLIPLLERVESHDVAVNIFFRQFRRIIVIDNQQNRTFAAERLASFLKLEGQENSDDFVLLSYVPR